MFFEGIEDVEGTGHPGGYPLSSVLLDKFRAMKSSIVFTLINRRDSIATVSSSPSFTRRQTVVRLIESMWAASSCERR